LGFDPGWPLALGIGVKLVWAKAAPEKAKMAPMRGAAVVRRIMSVDFKTGVSGRGAAAQLSANASVNRRSMNP
jgi:hypothetical protein